MKVKRNCLICRKESMLNKTHGLDSKSMGEALYCLKCRKLTPKQRLKIKI